MEVSWNKATPVIIHLRLWDFPSTIQLSGTPMASGKPQILQMIPGLVMTKSLLLKMTHLYIWFTYEIWWFSIAMAVSQRVPSPWLIAAWHRKALCPRPFVMPRRRCGRNARSGRLNQHGWVILSPDSMWMIDGSTWKILLKMDDLRFPHFWKPLCAWLLLVFFSWRWIREYSLAMQSCHRVRIEYMITGRFPLARHRGTDQSCHGERSDYRTGMIWYHIMSYSIKYYVSYITYNRIS